MCALVLECERSAYSCPKPIRNDNGDAVGPCGCAAALRRAGVTDEMVDEKTNFECRLGVAVDHSESDSFGCLASVTGDISRHDASKRQFHGSSSNTANFNQCEASVDLCGISTPLPWLRPVQSYGRIDCGRKAQGRVGEFLEWYERGADGKNRHRMHAGFAGLHGKSEFCQTEGS